MASTTEPITPQLLALLRCPETMQTVRMASAEELGKINEAQRRVASATSASEFAQALVREDGAVAYPVINGVPVMLPGAAILLVEPTL